MIGCRRGLPLSLLLSLSFSLFPLFSHPRLLTEPVARSAITGRPDLHRTLSRRRLGSQVKPQARRGGEHAAGPEPNAGAGLAPTQERIAALSFALRLPPPLSSGVHHRTPLRFAVPHLQILSRLPTARRRDRGSRFGSRTALSFALRRSVLASPIGRRSVPASPTSRSGGAAGRGSGRRARLRAQAKPHAGTPLALSLIVRLKKKITCS